jgi:hypothetical protein
MIRGKLTLIVCPYCGAENYIGVMYCKNCLNRLRELTEKEIRLLSKSDRKETAEKILRRKLTWTKGAIRT